MKRNVFRKHTVIFGVLGAVFAVLLVLFCARKIVRAKNKSVLTTYTVRSELYENIIEIAGTVSAAKSQTLKSLNDGTVVGVYKKEGDAVQKGDLIVQLDDSEQQYNLANLDYEIAVAKRNQTAGKIKLMETQRNSLLRKIEDRKIVATFDGIIADLDVDPGDYLEAKDSIGTLVDTSYLTAEVEIAETDVAKLTIGQNVDFVFPAYGGTVSGYLYSYPAIGEITSRGATVVKAKVRIDDVPDGILPNFSFTGRIQVTEPEEKLIVETYAVGRDGDSAFVEVLKDDGKTERIAVEVEPYGIDCVNILSGLHGGEILVAQRQAARSGRMSVSSKNQKGGGNSRRR